MPIKVTYNPDMLVTGDLAHAAGRGRFLQEQDKFNEQIRQYDQSLAFKAQLARLENQRAHQAAQEQARQFNLSLDQKDRLAAAEAAMEQQKENRIWDQALLTNRANQEKALYEREQDRIQEERLQQEADDLKDYRLKQNKLGFSRLDAEREKLDYQRSRLDYDKVEKAKRGQTQEIKDQLEAQWIAEHGHKAGHGGKYPTSYQVYPDRDEMPTLDTVNEHLDGLKTHKDETGQVVWVNEHIGPADTYGKVHPDGVFRYFTLEDDGRDGLKAMNEDRIAVIEAHEKELTQKRTHDATAKKDSAKNDWDRKKYMMDALQTAVSQALQPVDTEDGLGTRKRGKEERREYIDTYMGEVRRMADEMEAQQEGQQEDIPEEIKRDHVIDPEWLEYFQNNQPSPGPFATIPLEGATDHLTENVLGGFETIHEMDLQGRIFDKQEALPEDPQEAQQEDPQVAELGRLSPLSANPYLAADPTKGNDALPEDPQENPMAEVQAAWSQKKSRGGALDEDWVEQKAIAAHELGMTVRPDGINEVGDLPAWTAFEFKGKLFVKQPDGKFLEVTRDIGSNKGAF